MLNIPHIPPNNRLSSSADNLQTPPSVEHQKQDITPVSARMAASIIAIAMNEHHFSGNEIRHQLKALHFTDNVARLSPPSTPSDSDYASLSSPTLSRADSASGSWEFIPSQSSPDCEGEPGKHAYRHRPANRQLGPKETLSETPMKLNAQGTLYQGMPRHVQYAAPIKANARAATNNPLPMKLNVQGTLYQGMARHVQYAAPIKANARAATSNPLPMKLNAQGTLYQGMARHVQYTAPAKTHAQPASSTPLPMKLNAQGTLYQGMPRHVQYTAPAKTHAKTATSTPIPMKLNAQGTLYQGMPRHVQYTAPAKTHARTASSTPIPAKLNAQGTLYQGMPRHVQYTAPAKTHARPASSTPIPAKLNAQGSLYQGIPQPTINDTTMSGVKKYPTEHHTRTDFQNFTHRRQASVNEGVFIQSEEYADDGLDSAHLNQLFPDYEDYQIFPH